MLKVLPTYICGCRSVDMGNKSFYCYNNVKIRPELPRMTVPLHLFNIDSIPMQRFSSRKWSMEFDRNIELHEKLLKNFSQSNFL